MEFTEFINFDKDNMSDRMYKFTGLVDASFLAKFSIQEKLELKKLELEIIESNQRVLYRQKHKHLKFTESEVKDAVNAKVEVQDLKKELLYLEIDLKEERAKLSILKDMKDIMLSLNNDKREEKRSGRLLDNKGGHSE